MGTKPDEIKITKGGAAPKNKITVFGYKRKKKQKQELPKMVAMIFLRLHGKKSFSARHKNIGFGKGGKQGRGEE